LEQTVSPYIAYDEQIAYNLHREVTLTTVERDGFSTVQLASHTVELYDSLPSSAPGTSSNIATRPPTTSYFSIPLTSDTPQAVR
jgi:hypothetical protein